MHMGSKPKGQPGLQTQDFGFCLHLQRSLFVFLPRHTALKPVRHFLVFLVHFLLRHFFESSRSRMTRSSSLRTNESAWSISSDRGYTLFISDVFTRKRLFSERSCVNRSSSPWTNDSSRSNSFGKEWALLISEVTAPRRLLSEPFTESVEKRANTIATSMRDDESIIDV